ncbi:tripartite motif-containing protein 2-like [Ostrea edulis]|uniref:tripartite motif-containing protein 2-like n=1 Tax=Ostrea edulis TaxID=37623 RepID=UPI0024AFE1F0|nr:tripartite motif-containing protein 2-like [Ostrea edulis]
MAHSKLSTPSLGTPQHFLECDIKNCERNCQFYCNPCHQQMCEQCRDEHLKNPEYKNHEVVLYQQRKRQLPVEKCKIHPTKDIDMLCEECQLPLCSKCATQEDHRRHTFIDLETVYTDKMALCLEEISKVNEYFLPTSQDLQKEIKGDSTEIKMIMDSIRRTMKADGESLKNMADKVVSENIQQVDNIEQSLLEKLQSQDTRVNDYISYLHDLVKKFHGYISSSKLTDIIPKLSEKFQEIRLIPETTKPVTPVFTAGQYSKDDVAKLMGKIIVKDTNAEIREIKSMEIVPPSTSMEFTSQQKKRDRHRKSDVKQTMSLSSSVTEARKVNVPGVNQIWHMSLEKSGRLWVSDDECNLVQTAVQGNQLQKIQSSGEYGYHTVTQDGDLIFTDIYNNVINKITLDNNITAEFINTGDWEPLSIHSSHINGDILVGMGENGETKVTRYNKTGKELQNIQRDNKGQKLYSRPIYITENINGDVCVSDFDKEAVVVVNKSGQRRFSYRGQESGFRPRGICTDVLGHILVCDNTTVHLLDQDGQFLSLLLTKQHGIDDAISVCVDDENNLYVGQHNNNTVTVYKYLQ